MSKKQISLYCFIALSFFIGVFLSKTPANIVLSQVSEYAPVNFYQVKGTIWEGSAVNIHVNVAGKPFPLGKTHWDISPLYLLVGKLGIEIDAKHNEQIIKGDFVFGVNKSLSAKNIQIVSSAEPLGKLSPFPVKLEGVIDVNLHEVAISDMKVTAIDGSAVIKDMAINFSGVIDMGTFASRLSLDEDLNVLAKLTDVDAVMGLKGDFVFDQTDKKYDLKMQVTPKPEANKMITQGLSTVSRRNSDGSYNVTYSGKI